MMNLPNLISLRMPRGHFLLAVLISGCAATGLLAQAPSPTPEAPPEPPLIVPAPQKAEWTIAFQWTDARPSDPPDGSRLLTTTTTKVDDIEREVSHWGDGKQSERWTAGGLAMTQQPTWPPDMVVSEPRPPSEGDFGLAWIQPKHFQGTVSLEGKSCHYYVAPDQFGASRGLKGEGGKGDPVIKIWIDAKSRLPLMVQTSEVRKRFTYVAATVSSLTLPPAFARRYTLYLSSQRNKASTTNP